MGLQIRGLRKSFGGMLLYDGFSLDIKEGKVTAITGPSGCGKTTLLRLLAGLEEVDSGTFAWKHTDIAVGQKRMGEDRSGMGEGYVDIDADRGSQVPGGMRSTWKTAFVFQEDRLLPWLTVRENLRLVMRPEATEEEMALRVEEMLSFMGLSEFGDYYPEKLSGGMQRRVAVGRALLYDGDILLMDEPFKGLDETLKQHIMEMLSAEWKRRGSTVVLVTHDVEDARVLADRLWEFSGNPVESRLVFDRDERAD